MITCIHIFELQRAGGSDLLDDVFSFAYWRDKIHRLERRHVALKCLGESIFCSRL